MPGSIRIHLYCLCWNDARMLPYFFRHYDEFVDQYFVYDNGSTDASLMLLRDHGRVQIEHFDVDGDSFVEEERRLGDRIWQASRGKADWVIVTDIDEHIFRPDLVGYLERCQAQGITAIESIGYEMVADHFPTADDKLVNLVTRGCRSAGLNRLCIFNPNAITATHFSPGRHKAWPEGHVVWPASSEVLLLHFKQLGIQYVSQRSAELARGMKSRDIQEGWGTHYQWDDTAIRENWEKMNAEAVPVPGLGELRNVAPEDFRGEEKIIDVSGLLDEDWYLARYPDVADTLGDSLTHFCRYGWREGRRPNFYFDPAWYATTYPLAAASPSSPLVHYIQEGERAGNCPSPYFDTGWYRVEHALDAEESPLRHYLLRRATGLVKPVPDFDLEAFCLRHPEVLEAGLDPFEEYVRRGGASPEPALATYPHFADIAAKLGVDPNRGAYPANVSWRSFVEIVRMFVAAYPVDELWYRQVYADVDEAIRSGKVDSAHRHFIDHGFFEGRQFRATDLDDEN